MSGNIDLNQEVLSALPAVMAKLRESIIDKMNTEAHQVAMEAVRAEVRDWAEKELVPEIRAQLQAGKAALVTQAEGISESLGQLLAAALVDNAKKSLSGSYVVKEIAEKIFRGY